MHEIHVPQPGGGKEFSGLLSRLASGDRPRRHFPGWMPPRVPPEHRTPTDRQKG
jgi:hypothetical protein